MHLSNILVTLSALATSVSAEINLRNYVKEDCKGNYVQCNRVDQQFCCDLTLAKNHLYSSTLFLGQGPRAVGLLCPNKNCGNPNRAGRGPKILCVTKKKTKGSYWFDCQSCGPTLMARQVDVSSLGDIPPVRGVAQADILAFEGHQFRIDNSTPAEAVASLVNLFELDSDYADIPEELKQYELAEPIGEESEHWEE